jgi:hypothetical protein
MEKLWFFALATFTMKSMRTPQRGDDRKKLKTNFKSVDSL